MHYTYTTEIVCSKKIDFDIEGNVISNIVFTGGCNGNLKGIGKLVEGEDIDKVISKLGGITCNTKSTSCPDQLAQALMKTREE